MMQEKKKKMLIIGPGYGHNVDSTLTGMAQCNEFDISFWAYNLDDSFIEKFKYINFIKPQMDNSKKHPLRFLLSVFRSFGVVRRNDIDVIYSLGMGGYFTALSFFLSKKRTKKAIEIYSVHIIESARRNKTVLNKCDRYVLDKADFICQYWWGVRELFVNAFPQYEDKFLIYPKSYPDIFFSNEKRQPSSDFVKNFLSRIPEGQKMCFWPRSFIPSNNHKLLLDSLGLIKKEKPELLENFKLFLWGGNVEDSSSKRLIEEAIIRNKLSNNVEIVNHPFVPREDIFAIEDRSDFFVQIANDDILSSYIMEMIGSGKPFILSNLRTFQFLNEKYDLDIDLVDNDVIAIANRLKNILSGLSADELIEFENRKNKCAKLFSWSKTKRWYTALYDKIRESEA